MDMFYVHPSNIVRTLAALEMQGMITRSPHDKDKRTCKLYPTERALSIIDEVQTVCKKALKGALLALTRQFFPNPPYSVTSAPFWNHGVLFAEPADDFSTFVLSVVLVGIELRKQKIHISERKVV